MKSENYHLFKMGKHNSITWRLFTLITWLCLISLTTGSALGAPMTRPQSDENAPPYTWGTKTVDSSRTFYDMRDHSMRFDTNGNPHVAYGGDGLFYTWYDGTSWYRVTVDSNPGAGQYANLALDLSNRPRIAYYDSVRCSLKFAYTNDTTPYLPEDWTVMYVAQPASTSACLQLPLADRVAKPLALNESAIDGTLSPESTNAPTWEYPQGATGLFPSLTIDSNNGLHLSYYDTQVEEDKEEIGKLYYGYWDGESPWQLVVVDHRNDVGSFSSIAVDTNNHPMISYMIEKYDQLRFAECTHECSTRQDYWEITTVDASDNNVGSFSSLVVDSANRPHISYYDATNKNLKYAVRDSDEETFDVSTVDSDGDVGWYTSIALDVNNNVYITYFDQSEGDLRILVNPGKSNSESVIVAYKGTVGRFSSVDTYMIDEDDDGSYHDDYAFIGISYYVSDTDALAFALYDEEEGEWTFTSLDYGYNVGLSSSLALDSDNRPFISYFNDSTDTLRIAAGYHENGKDLWFTDIVSNTASAGMYSSLALDNFGNPYIAYYDETEGNLRFAYWRSDPRGWTHQTIDGSLDSGQYVSLVMDKFNFPHLSYYDAIDKDPFYKHWYDDGKDNTWVIRNLDVNNDQEMGEYTSIDVYYDPDNGNDIDSVHPGISFYDEGNGDLKFSYMTKLGVWKDDTVDSTGDVGQYTSVKYDSNDRPHIIYYDVTNQDLKYAFKDAANNWYIYTVDTAGDVGMYASLAIDSGDNLHASYYDATNGDLMYAYKPAASPTWQTEKIEVTGDVGGYTSIDLYETGGQAYPAISYYDFTMEELKYAYTKGPFPTGDPIITRFRCFIPRMYDDFYID